MMTKLDGTMTSMVTFLFFGTSYPFLTPDVSRFDTYLITVNHQVLSTSREVGPFFGTYVSLFLVLLRENWLVLLLVAAVACSLEGVVDRVGRWLNSKLLYNCTPSL